MTVRSGVQINDETRVSEIIRLSQISGTRYSHNSQDFFDLETPHKITDCKRDSDKGGQSECNNNYNFTGATEGQVPQLLSRNYIGLLVNYWSVGILYGAANALIMPVVVYMNHGSNQTVNAAMSLTTIFWSFKVFYGWVTDCYPILGLRRKPYILFGWTSACIVLVAMACMGDSPAVLPFVVMMMAINFCYIWSEVAGDGLMVEVAHREPIELRGKAQSTVFFVRQLGFTVAALLVGIFFNSKEYQGSFDFGLTVSQFTWVLLVLTAGAIPTAMYFLKDDKVEQEIDANGEPISHKQKSHEMARSFFSLLQNRATYQVIAWLALNNFFAFISNAAVLNSAVIWLKMTTLQNSLSMIVQNMVFAIGIAIINKRFLNVNWRKLIIFSFFIMQTFNLPYLLVAFGAVTNVWFFIFTQVGAQFVYSWNFMVGSFCIVEIGPDGMESITYALATTVNNLLIPFSQAISNQIAGPFKVQPADLETVFQLDPSGVEGALVRVNADVPYRFTYLTFLIFAINCMSLVFLPLLPKQKKETRDLVALNQRSTIAGVIIIIFVILGISYGTLINILAVIPSTACLKIAGGSGCQT